MSKQETSTPTAPSPSPEPSVAHPSPSPAPAPSPATAASEASVDGSRAAASSSAAAAGDVPGDGAGDAPPVKQANPNRCYSCNKRVGFTGFECRCGFTYCATHRHANKHECSFDFKAMGRDAVAKANPAVIAEKVDKVRYFTSHARKLRASGARSLDFSSLSRTCLTDPERSSSRRSDDAAHEPLFSNAQKVANPPAFVKPSSLERGGETRTASRAPAVWRIERRLDARLRSDARALVITQSRSRTTRAAARIALAFFFFSQPNVRETLEPGVRKTCLVHRVSKFGEGSPHRVFLKRNGVFLF